MIPNFEDFVTSLNSKVDESVIAPSSPLLKKYIPLLNDYRNIVEGYVREYQDNHNILMRQVRDLESHMEFETTVITKQTTEPLFTIMGFIDIYLFLFKSLEFASGFDEDKQEEKLLWKVKTFRTLTEIKSRKVAPQSPERFRSKTALREVYQLMEIIDGNIQENK